MKKFIIIFLLVIIIYPIDMKAQVSQEWVATYNGTGSGYNFPKKMAIDFQGNIIVAGNSDSTHGYDYIILKYTPSGNLIWKQRYNGIGNGYDYLTSMVLDDSGNVYVTGSSEEGASHGGINWVTIKYNTSGLMKWNRSLNWTANLVDENFGMNIDKDRNIYVIGFGRVTSLERAMVTMKYDSNGDSVWCTSYRSLPQRSNWGYSVVADDSDNIYSSGYGAVPTGNEIITIKYSFYGNEQWIQRYPTYYGDYLRPTLSTMDKENNLVVIGYNYTQNSDYDFVTLKYDRDGKLLWSRLFDRGHDDYANSLFLDSKSNILICGSSVDSTLKDYLILKYSSDGDTLLVKKIPGPSTDEAFSIVSDGSDNIYVTGYSQPFSSLFYYLTIKLNSLGAILWSKYYNYNYDNFAYNLCLDKSGNIYISGAGDLKNGNSGIMTLKYSQLTGMEIIKFENFDNIHLSNYPNPFNASTKISYSLPENGAIKLIIYDISGREIETLLNENKNKGSYEINFLGDKFASGPYLYSLLINNEIVKTSKMLIIK